MMQTELAGVMDVGKVTLGGLIDRLEASGFVTRKPDANDRRVKRVKMTRAGDKVLRTITKVAGAIDNGVVKDLTAKEIKQTETALHKIKKRLIEMDS